jgi:hypothetical protein
MLGHVLICKSVSTFLLKDALFGLLWNRWEVIAEMVTAGAAVIAIALGIPAWIRRRRTLKREIINELFREYSSCDMGDAVKLLHDAFRHSTRKDVYSDIEWKDKRRWIDHYEQLYRKKSFELHNARRMVSSFYQRIAFSAKGRFVRRVVLEMWGQKNHPFVMNVLLPIETVAMPELLSRKEYREEVPPVAFKYPMWLMFHFWKREPLKRWWRFRTNSQRLAWEEKQDSQSKHMMPAHTLKTTNHVPRASDVLRMKKRRSLK